MNLLRFFFNQEKFHKIILTSSTTPSNNSIKYATAKCSLLLAWMEANGFLIDWKAFVLVV